MQLTPKFEKLWKSLTPDMKARLAKQTRSTVSTLRQYAVGRRHFTSESAIRLEKATIKLGVEPLNRADLSEACRSCEYARACRGRRDLA